MDDLPGHPYLAGRENLEVVADMAGLGQLWIEEVFEWVGPRPTADRRFGTHLIGMEQCLEVATALLEDRALLTLDDPAMEVNTVNQRKEESTRCRTQLRQR